MNIFKIERICLIGFLFLCSFFSVSGINPNQKGFNHNDFGLNYELENWSVAEDSLGEMYFGNASGILKYDGVRWNYIPVKEGSWITALTTSEEGTIYVGGQHDFGFLQRDKYGNVTYKSLCDSSLKKKYPFTNIWRIHAIGEKVFFQSEAFIFVYQHNKFEVLKPESSFHLSFNVNNYFFVRDRARGLLKYQHGKLKLLPGGDFFKQIGVSAMLKQKGSDILVVSFNQGCWRFNIKTGVLDELETDKRLAFCTIFGAIMKDRNMIVLNTSDCGVMIVDSNLHLKYDYNHENGLFSNDVKQVFINQQNNLWALTSKGINRIQFNSPFRRFGKNNGLEEIPLCLEVYQKKLWIGSAIGLKNVSLEAIPDSVVSFEVFPKLHGQVRVLLTKSTSMFVASNKGLYVLNNNQISKINNDNCYSLYLHKDNQLLVGTGKGFKIYGLDKDTVKLIKAYPVFDQVVQIEGSPDFSADEVWLGTAHEGLYCIQRIHDTITLQHFDKDNGLPDGYCLPFVYKNDMMFATSYGIMKKEKQGDVLQFNFVDAFEKMEVTPYFVKSDRHRLWLASGQQLYLKVDTVNHWIYQPFRSISHQKIFDVYSQDGISLIASQNGLYQYRHQHGHNYKKSFYCYISRVTARENGENTNKAIHDKGVLAYGADIDITFRAPFYEHEDKVQYTYMLEGYDAGWRSWQDAASASYRKLPAGDYVFRVKAENHYQTRSNIADYHFKILSPWYVKPYMIVLYIIFLALFIYGVVQLNIRRLKIKNRKLEAIIEERTMEIRRQRDEIKDSIHYAYHIQHALMPKQEDLGNWFDERFVLWLPRDIVSGDFYWFGEENDRQVIVAADCTGHGVPGAFMSMLGISFFNDIVHTRKITDPNKILDQLRYKIIHSLKQAHDDTTTKDGMDVALIVLDKMHQKVWFSGAYNPLWVLRNNEIIELKADRMPCAIHIKMQNFNVEAYDLQKDDRLYLISDGFVDQFGGEESKKYTKKRLKNLLIQTSHYDMNTQKLKLIEQFEKWRGNLEQLDDVTILGLKI